MKRVTGIGGIFFKSNDPEALGAWYRDHLGSGCDRLGWCHFQLGRPGKRERHDHLERIQERHDLSGAWNRQFHGQFPVADLHALLAALRAEGCNVEDRTEESEQGKAGWVIDPEGNKVELWEPPIGQ